MADGFPNPETIQRWLGNLDRFDPELARTVKGRAAKAQPRARRAGGAATESAAADAPPDMRVIVETMVRPGRPVLPIKGDAVARDPAFIEPPDGEIMVQRLLGAAATINPIIPLVGRIDVANFPRNASFVGTGWLIDPDIVVTNSHVASLIGRRDGRGYTFLPGRFGDPLVTSVELEARDGQRRDARERGGKHHVHRVRHAQGRHRLSEDQAPERRRRARTASCSPKPMPPPAPRSP